MTELDRYKKALDVALEAMGVLSGNSPAPSRVAFRVLKQREIDAILSPPPEYEEVEVEAGWVNVYQDDGVYRTSGSYKTRRDADDGAGLHRIDCQEIKVKVRCQKPRMVGRSMVVPVTYDCVSDIVTATVSIPSEAHGKPTTITVGWLEPEGGAPSK